MVPRQMCLIRQILMMIQVTLVLVFAAVWTAVPFTKASGADSMADRMDVSQNGRENERKNGNVSPAGSASTVAPAENLDEWRLQPQENVAPTGTTLGPPVPEPTQEDVVGIEEQEKAGWLASQIRRFRTFPHIDRAYRFIEAGDLEQARRELEASLRIDPTDRQVRLAYVSLLYRLGKYKEVIANIQRVTVRDGQAVMLIYRGLARDQIGEVSAARADFLAAADLATVGGEDWLFALGMLADLALREQDYEAALQALARLEEVQRSSAVLLRQGFALSRLGRAEAAEAAHRQAVKLATTDEERVQALQALGYTLAWRDNLEEAQAVYEEARRLNPENQTVSRALATVAYMRGDYAKAIDLMRDVLATGTTTAPDYEFLGNLFYETTHYGDALEQYQRFLQSAASDQQRYRAYLSLGYTSQALQQHEQAAEAFRAAVEVRADVQALLALAQALENAGRLDQAIAALEAAPAEARSPQVLARLGFLYSKAGDDEKAADALRAASAGEALAPDERYRLFMAEGFAYANQGQHEQAAEAFRAAVEVRADAQALLALAQALENAGREEEVIDSLERAIKVQPSSEIHGRLALLLAERGNDERAAFHLQQAMLEEGPGDQLGTLFQRLGYMYAARNQYHEARQAFQQAMKRNPDDPADLLRALGNASLGLNNYDEAIRYFRQSLDIENNVEALKGLATAYIGADRPEDAVFAYNRLVQRREISASDRAFALTSLGFLYRRMGDEEKAVGAFQQAAAIEGEKQEARINLGLSLAALERWEDALSQFERAAELEPSAQIYLYIGRAYRELEQPARAVDNLERALSERDELLAPEQQELLNELALSYAMNEQYDRAADVLKDILAKQYEAQTALRMAQMQRLAGAPDQALQTLESIPPFTLPARLQSTYYAELAQLYAETEKFESAVEAAKQALRLTPSAQKAYSLGIYYQRLNRPQDAVPHLQAAVESDPQNELYQMTLGFAYDQAGMEQEALQVFEDAVAKNPNNIAAQQQIAYLRIRKGDLRGAEESFKRAIDLKLVKEPKSEGEREQRDREIYAMRQEVRALERVFEFTAYQTYASDNREVSITPGGTIGGIIPSQGGISLAYRPPKIGLVDGRIFQVFSRLLWTNELNSLEPDFDSATAGAGVLYKPFSTQNLYISGERLFGIGSESEDDWLLRATYGWQPVYDIMYNQRSWNYSLIYGDLGYFVRDGGTVAFYGELRQGISYNIKNRFVVTPHLVLDGRVQSPDPGDISYLQGGVGISFSYLFNESRYQAPRSSLELTLQYKEELVNFGGGFIGTLIFRF